jgi:hypothetical protein
LTTNNKYLTAATPGVVPPGCVINTLGCPTTLKTRAARKRQFPALFNRAAALVVRILPTLRVLVAPAAAATITVPLAAETVPAIVHTPEAGR